MMRKQVLIDSESISNFFKADQYQKQLAISRARQPVGATVQAPNPAVRRQHASSAYGQRALQQPRLMTEQHAPVFAHNQSQPRDFSWFRKIKVQEKKLYSDLSRSNAISTHNMRYSPKRVRYVESELPKISDQRIKTERGGYTRSSQPLFVP